MAEVAEAKAPATENETVRESSAPEKDVSITQKADADVPSSDAPAATSTSDSAHAEDRRQNDSARVKEAQKYNNRDRNRHNGKRDERSFKKRDYSKNNKFDPSSLPQSSDPALIRKQVEFYFSDSNLHSDKFLFTHIEGSKNNPVPIDVIHKFKRMQRFQPRSAIISALKESSTLDVVNDDNDIQRKVPLPEGLVGKPLQEIKEVHENKSMAQSIYAKGFGEEEASSQFDIEAFFAKFGTTNSVRLRRDMRGNFKGSVFVEFDTEEQAKSFLALDPAPKYKDNELILKSKKEYCDEKVEDIKAGKVRPNSPSGSFKRKFDGEARDGGERDWRQRRDEESKDGFRSRRGNHRGGHRGSDRGRRGDRGRGRGRDRNDRGGRQRQDSPSNDDESASNDVTEGQKDKNVDDAPATDSASKEKEASAKVPQDTVAPVTNGVSTLPETSKKRQREGDDAAVELPAAKKIDDKPSE